MDTGEENMTKNIETLIYEISLRVRLFMMSKRAGNTAIDLTDRECLLLELVPFDVINIRTRRLIS